MMDRRAQYIREHRGTLDAALAVETVACAALAVVLIVAGLAWRGLDAGTDGESVATDRTPAVAAVVDKPVSATSPTLARAKVPAVDRELSRARWTEPTGGAQPDLSRYPNLSVEVNLAKQRVYVRSDGHTVYAMIASTGMDDSTPHGSFTIGVRGDHFYNPDERMGADYWVCIKGPYLFHSVPTNEHAGQYLEDEGAKLGRPASHGCVRLSVADAKWFYDQIPTGTPVTIA